MLCAGVLRMSTIRLRIGVRIVGVVWVMAVVAAAHVRCPPSTIFPEGGGERNPVVG
jgi:hypothetical protein